MPRLSIDIDLNYIGQIDREAMLAERPEVERALEAVCGRAGIAIDRTPGAHAGGNLPGASPSLSWIRDVRHAYRPTRA